MFVQSHIQRHHHHQHHNNNNNSNNHQHNHSHSNNNNNNNNNNHHRHHNNNNHNSQQHSHSQHQKYHHNASSSSTSSINNRRLANTSKNKVSSLSNSLIKSTTSIHSLKSSASSDKLSHGTSICTEAEKVQLVGEVVNSAFTLLSKNIQHDRNSNKHHHHRNELNSGENDAIIQNKSEKVKSSSSSTTKCAAHNRPSINPGESSVVSNASYDELHAIIEPYRSNNHLCNYDACGLGKISAINDSDEQQHQQQQQQQLLHSPLLRDRTRSLGSHKSLRVYDFMPRHTLRLAQVESATVVGGGGGHCEPPISISTTTTSSKASGSTCGAKINAISAKYQKYHQHKIAASTLRLAQTVSLERGTTSDTSCHDSNNSSNHCYSRRRRLIHGEGSEPRRAFSDVSESNSFWNFFAGSQQLLSNIYVDSSCWLAGRFFSTSSSQQLSAQQVSSAQQLFINNQSTIDELHHHNHHHHHRRQSFKLVQSFCMSFISYQLETWRLLANDLAAREKHQRTSTTVNGSGSTNDSSLTNRYDDDENCAKDPYDDRFNQIQIRSMTSSVAGGGFAPTKQHANLNGQHHHDHDHNHNHHHHQQQQQQQQQKKQQLKGRKFYSLDRPILERQREVNHLDGDDNDGIQEEVEVEVEEEEPFIRIPTIFKEPLPPHDQMQSAFRQLITAPPQRGTTKECGSQSQLHHLHHKHRHNHHDHSHNPPMTSSTRQDVREMNQFDANYETSLNFNNNNHYHHDDHNYRHHYPQNVEFDYGFATQTKIMADMATNQQQQQQQQKHTPPAMRAEFYLGQHSLDCDQLQVVSPPSWHLNFARTNHEPALLKKRECEFFSHNFRHETWNARPSLIEEDFRSTSVNCHLKQQGEVNEQEDPEEQEQQEEQEEREEEEGESRSNSNNCDQYDLKQENSITVNHLSMGQLESGATRKRKTLKKSLSPLSFDGARRRLGLRRKGEMNQLSSISVNRSEEVIPTEVRHLSRQTTFNSLYDSGTESGSFWHVQSQLPPDARASFIEGIGFGQIASRQALVSPNLGDIQLSLSSRRGMLEVEIIRARGLHAKAGSKSLPSPYVKVYLMKEKKCIAKCRTHQVDQTLDPLYQEPFVFRNEFKNCVLQVIVWGDYGKRDRKSMMGVVQIHLDDLDISNMVIGWYKLFNIPSMTNSIASSKNLRQRLLHHSSSVNQ